MLYLDGEDLLRLHKVVIDYAGGSHGIRDAILLGSILQSPKQFVDGQEVFPSVWHKAAVYMEKLAKFHVFVDGNKRTALAASARFLDMNGFALTVTNRQAEKFIVDIIVKKHNIPTIAAWLKKHSRKIRS